MTLEQALQVIQQAKDGVPMTTECWLRAVVIVDEAYPVGGYTTVDDDGAPDSLRTWMRQEADYTVTRLGY